MIRKLFKLFARAYQYYTRNGYGSEEWKKQFSFFGKNSVIQYPSILVVDGRLSIGDDTTILKNCRIQNYNHLNNSPCVKIGNHCYIGYYFSILNASTVTIGDDVLIASQVLISSENHGINPELDIPYMDQPLISKPVSIGDGSWIGEKVCILPGVDIGKKCIIGAGSVVTESIPDYSIAVGNPARVIKRYNFETHNWEMI